MATIYNPQSRDAVWLRSLGYSLKGYRQRGCCVDVWWRDPLGRIGPAGETYMQGVVVRIEREKRRTALKIRRAEEIKSKHNLRSMTATVECPLCGKVVEYDTDNDSTLCPRCGEVLFIEDDGSTSTP